MQYETGESFLLSGLEIQALAAVILWGAISYSIMLGKPVLTALMREYHPSPLGVLLFSMLESMLVVCAVFLALPLLLLYVIIYISTCTGLWLASRKCTQQVWFCINLLCVHIAIAHQLALSAMALWLGKNPYQIYNNPLLGLISVYAALLLLFCLFIVMKHVTDMERAEGLADVIIRRKEVGWFLWFALGYVVFDSIPCMFNLPYRLVSWFLLGSCLLLWVQLYLFLGYAYRVFMRQHFEHEYRLLEQQQLEHLKRTMELRKIAYTDGLTGAYTRSYIMKILRQWLKEQRMFSLAYIDLNGLKWVNDTFGHEAGDSYLVTVAAAVNRHLGANDVLARIGGDEFLALMPDVTAAAACAMMEAMEKELAGNGKNYTQSFSYGVEMVSPGYPLDAEEIIHQADVRMYEDKKRRKQQVNERGSGT